MNQVIHGDCLTESEQIESGSVDLILTDPPYGNMNGIDKEFAGYGRRCGDGHLWDVALQPVDIYSVANRILRKNGKLILFAQQPYTTELIKNTIPNLPHSYNMIWEKNDFANALLSKKAPVSYYEDVLVFGKMNPKEDNTGLNPAREYLRQERQKVREAGFTDKDLRKMCGVSLKGGGLLCHYWGRGQWILPTKKHYKTLQKTGYFQKPYEELERVAIPYRLDLNKKINEKYPAIFNLWEGKKYKSNILKYSKDYDGYHPTQKPVLLLEDLIKTFSNEGDLVVDLTAGSGSTAVACRNTGRNYIVIEKERKYIDIINKRIAEHEQQLALC